MIRFSCVPTSHRGWACRRGNRGREFAPGTGRGGGRVRARNGPPRTMPSEDRGLHDPETAGNYVDAERASARRRLLLVDDNENHCWALTRAFEKRGYVVKVAHSVVAACTLLEDWPPEYAIVDLRM